MAQIKWDEEGQHLYHTGVNKGVLFPFDNTAGRYSTGVAWNGLKTVTETPEGDENSDIYADNIKYLTLRRRLPSSSRSRLTLTPMSLPSVMALLSSSRVLTSVNSLVPASRSPTARSWVTTRRAMRLASCCTSSTVRRQRLPSVRTTRSRIRPRPSPSRGSARRSRSRSTVSSLFRLLRSTRPRSRLRSTRNSPTSCTVSHLPAVVMRTRLW